MLNLPRLRDFAVGVFTRRFASSPEQEQRRERLEQLAQEIVEYGRMVSTGRVIVWLPDVAYRLRESPHDLLEALHLLSTKGIAARTNLKDYWVIRC